MNSPALNSDTFKSVSQVSGPVMTLSGTINKTAILLALVIAGTVLSWNAGGSLTMGLTIGGALGGLIVGFVTIFKKEWSPVTAPIYALLEGLFLGGISLMYNAQFHGIVLQAIMLTFGVLATMLFLFQSRIVRVTERLKAGIMAATGAALLLILASFVLSFFNIPLLNAGGGLAIGLSLFIVVIAAMNLLLDFDMIEQGVSVGAPRYMEWYCSFGLMVTIIWLYLAILRLLANTQRR